MQSEMTHRERFLNFMGYKPVDRVPNFELGVWPQTWARWREEGMPAWENVWWFWGDERFGLDPRDYVKANFQMIPHFERECIEMTDEYEVIRHETGIVTKALREGTVGGMRSSMDQYLSHGCAEFSRTEEAVRRV
jgi:uroporphyrinogen decarboxylase